MNNNISKQLGLLFFGLYLVATVYGGLYINKLNKQNIALDARQTKIENKITELENTLIASQNQIIDLTQSLTQAKSDLTYYKKIAANLQNQVDSLIKDKETATLAVATKVDQPIAVPAIKKKTVVKKVTNTVYVKEVKHEVTVTIKGLGSYQVNIESGDTALSVLKQAAADNKFNLETQSYSFGDYVTQIGDQKPASNEFWAFYYNGNFSQVGASDQKVSDNDTIFWQLEKF
ncbi:MAG: DUF4430 domain-containing protein [Candidatus Berkelbacteria bacterium]